MMGIFLGHLNAVSSGSTKNFSQATLNKAQDDSSEKSVLHSNAFKSQK